MKVNKLPSHVAIILDGNRRWAKKRAKPTSYGHYQGAMTLFRVAKDAKHLGIKRLTVFAFSTENWNRPLDEVNYLMTKPIEYFHENRHRISDIEFKIKIIGRRDRLSKELIDVIEKLEKETLHHDGFELVVCLDYGSKDEIINAVNRLNKPISAEELNKNLYLSDPVDLLIRTSGEMRLSNFLLWQSAYAELYFTKKYWPEFKRKDLEKAIKCYQKRHRRFGGI
jgi:undecaprenyl diphosphate synthase